MKGSGVLEEGGQLGNVVFGAVALDLVLDHRELGVRREKEEHLLENDLHQRFADVQRFRSGQVLHRNDARSLDNAVAVHDHIAEIARARGRVVDTMVDRAHDALAPQRVVFFQRRKLLPISTRSEWPTKELRFSRVGRCKSWVTDSVPGITLMEAVFSLLLFARLPNPRGRFGVLQNYT